ncbi:23254_t:CDS:2 [Entrophospora sp. SA101]|nr:8884_t:CDS:2 [Entrophospora sp. SA101]CAJ0639281.1 7560_t:CDS:2 [Entrophospora sp. SA101]CAJ0763713.1 23254_t:CDS:2 [Entrophospora sp. SA101]CAJ0836273.1 17623_t:CDS:2 [Entrophospora sp. SA101]CAJ0925606.1 9048_t:CDS:2 [Entrophospora sp. SA101]
MEALESTQNQEEIVPLQIPVFENTSTNPLLDSSSLPSSNEQTTHINAPNQNTSQEMIEKAKEPINNSEPLPKNEDNDNIQIESNNMELVSSNVQEVKNNTNISSNDNVNNHNHNKAPFSLRKLSDAGFQALPPGSRLFLGNLSTHSTTKKELYDIFSPYGEIFEISIKNSFGFIQYDNTERLEVSHGKLHHRSQNQDTGHKNNFGHHHEKRWNQRGGNKNNWHNNNKREYSPARGHHTQTHNNWHYNKEGNERRHSRDSYREDHRDQKNSHRSKPYRVPNRDYSEQKQSRDNRSQLHDKANDEFPLPRRQGNAVPECQIIVLEEVDRNYLWQAENAFREAKISVHTLHLSRKLQIQAVVRQMIVEGVHAVVFLERALIMNGRVNMQIFEHQRSQDNVKYDEYNNIRIEDAVGLLSRAHVSSVPNNMLTGGQQILPQTQKAAPIIEQPNALNINPISLNNVNFAALANLLVVSPGTNLQHQPGFMSAQPQNFDVQQILGNLAPANAPNQQRYTQVFPHNTMPFNTSMINQHNVNNPNVMPPPQPNNTLPLPQHQPQHVAPNLQQFHNQIPGSSNITDLMTQFNNYNN